MAISRTTCPECNQPFRITRLACPTCNLAMEGQIELSPLDQLAPEDQAFVMAFVRHHGSIKKMEELFGISYPTVKNRLNAIAARLDKSLQAPSAARVRAGAAFPRRDQRGRSAGEIGLSSRRNDDVSGNQESA